jgi:hypothetical protein
MLMLLAFLVIVEADNHSLHTQSLHLFLLIFRFSLIQNVNCFSLAIIFFSNVAFQLT